MIHLRYSYLKLKLSLNNVVGLIIITYVYMLQYKFCATTPPPPPLKKIIIMFLQVYNLILTSSLFKYFLRGCFIACIFSMKLIPVYHQPQCNCCFFLSKKIPLYLLLSLISSPLYSQLLPFLKFNRNNRNTTISITILNKM